MLSGGTVGDICIRQQAAIAGGHNETDRKRYCGILRQPDEIRYGLRNPIQFRDKGN